MASGGPDAMLGIGRSIVRVTVRSGGAGWCNVMNPGGASSPAADVDLGIFSGPSAFGQGTGSSTAHRAQVDPSPAPPPSAGIGSPQRMHRNPGTIG
jgi:hypothetical protein